MLKDDRNIVLIGMPGSGKTTIGCILAQRLGRNLIDMDEYIERQQGCTINQLFLQGERHFRRLEAETAQKLESVKASVITTGGGIVKNAANMESLRKNGIIIFLDRSIEDIASDVDTSTRPLLAEGTAQLAKLYAERYDLYRKYSDYTVKNNGEIAGVVENIIRIVDKDTIGGC
ncbi:MAG TPA: shikimate kinase [Negativicutes bacterium]|nr:shikimate kinase [Negativicutes bacterium]